MNARSSFTFSSLALALGLALAACSDGGGSGSSTSSSSSGGDTTSSSSSSGGSKNDIEVGKAFTMENGCAGCHSADFSGGKAAFMGVYPANLTPDKETGIGDWTDDQIKKAVKEGVDDEGKQLCASMPKFATATDEQLTGLVAYLRSLPAVNKETMEGTCK